MTHVPSLVAVSGHGSTKLLRMRSVIAGGPPALRQKNGELAARVGVDLEYCSYIEKKVRTVDIFVRFTCKSAESKIHNKPASENHFATEFPCK